MDERAYRALREGVSATRGTHVRALRFSGGDGAWATLSEIACGDLFLRDGQALHGLWLDERARPIFDLHLLRDDESFVALGESRDTDPLDHARAHARGGVVIEDLGDTHDVVSLDGPFAWELAAELLGPEVVGLPYLGGYAHEGGWVLRAGKTGEFGYDVVLPKERAAHLVAAIDDAAPRFDLAWADRDVLEQCMLENWFFNVRREGARDVTPLELQLQWRTTRSREFVGSRALEARRAEGIARRLVTLVSGAPMADGEPVALLGETVGEIVNAGHAPLAGAHVALALVDLAWACSGIDFETPRGVARSMTPPLPNNRSLFVSPQQHSYATRDEIAAPPLFSGVPR